MNEKCSIKEWLDGKTIVFFLLVVVLVFQDPLALKWKYFSYVDEAVAFVGGMCLIWHGKEVVNGLKNSRYVQILVTALGVFVLIGVLGNVIFRYQPLKYWVVDLYTNLKFFLALALGFFGLSCRQKETKRGLMLGAQFCSTVLIALFIADRLFNLFPGQVRIGMKSAQLFYFHSTYLAGALAFLISVLILFYEKRYQAVLIFADALILFMTLRGKASATALVFCILWVQIMMLKKEIKIWHVICIGVVTLAVGWKQISFYFIQLSGWSGRSIILQTCFKVMRDYFPIGTGFGTYGSHVAAAHYSPVYVKYGFLETDTLIPGGTASYFDDQFWPIIIGQTGFLGTIAYVTALVVLLVLCWKLKQAKRNEYLTGLFIFVYLLLSSTGEPAFNNMVGIPMAVTLGALYQKNQRIYSNRLES